MRTHTILILAVSFMIAADNANKSAKDDRAKLQGTWKIVSLEVNGAKPIGDDQLETVQAVFDADGKLTVKADENVIYEAKTKIDPTKKPKTIDLTYTEGQMAGETALGIYELKDDTFRYCRAAPGKDRPKEFSAKEESGHTLAVYKRVKK